MADALSMSLDDIIKSKNPKRTAAGATARKRGAAGKATARQSSAKAVTAPSGRGRGASARGQSAVRRSTSKASSARQPLVTAAGSRGRGARRGNSTGTPSRADADGKWQHDKFAAVAAPPARTSASKAVPTELTTGTRVLLGNLADSVVAADLQELFGKMAALKRVSMVSTGTAELVFVRRDDAVNIVKKYDGVKLDGRVMFLKLDETATSLPAGVRVKGTGSVFSRLSGLPVVASPRGRGRGRASTAL